MYTKGRKFRANFALVSLGYALLLGADAWGNRYTTDYYHDRALAFVLGFVAVAVVMFAWNAIQYALHLRNK